jgi:hypothetical protein
MNKEEAQAFYKGKTFFIKNPDGSLNGPRNDIYYVNKEASRSHKFDKYDFVQVIDGTIKQAFTKDEIIVVQE